MTSLPKVSVVIVNYNGTSDTIECLRSLKKVNYTNFETIIVDNGSNKEQLMLLKKSSSPYVKRIVELKRNLGFAIANNVGIRLALHNHSDYVLLLNNDTIVDDNFLMYLVCAAEKDKSIGVVGPKMYFYEPRNKLWFAGGKLNMYFRHKTEGLKRVDRGEYDKQRETDYIAGACMLIRSEVFQKIGLLPREYFLGWEDIDFCVATKRAGYKIIFSPKSILWHKASASFQRHGLSYIQVYFGFRNRVILRYKYLSQIKFCGFVTAQLSVIIPIHILYYLLAYKDSRRVMFMLNGFKTGLEDMRDRDIKYEIDIT